jgi:hypothetical protein
LFYSRIGLPLTHSKIFLATVWYHPLMTIISCIAGKMSQLSPNSIIPPLSILLFGVVYMIVCVLVVHIWRQIRVQTPVVCMQQENTRYLMLYLLKIKILSQSCCLIVSSLLIVTTSMYCLPTLNFAFSSSTLFPFCKSWGASC